MAELIIPDSKFEMPGLFYPGRKPVGGVKIDWAHPMARGLSLHYLANGEISFPITENSSTPVITKDGVAVSFRADSTDRIAIPEKYTKANLMKQEFTIIARFTLPNPSGVPAYIFNSSLRVNIAIGREGIFGVGCSWYDGNVFRAFDFGTPLSTQPYTMIFTKVRGVEARAALFSDEFGFSEIVDTINLGDISYAARWADIGARLHAPANNGQEVIVHELCYYNRAFSPSESRSYYNNPYQFLIPA